MMVAAPKHDLRAAANCGLKSGFVRRPHEYGRSKNTDLADDPAFTVKSNDFNDLADRRAC